MSKFVAAIEAGGTKFNCAIVDQNRTILAEARIATTQPNETLRAVIDFFAAQKLKGFDFNTIGLACFGPIDIKPDSPTYGHIRNTPKPAWSNTPICDILQQALNCKVLLDTDVNCAAIAEYKWGAARGANVAVYITVGTGVGGGVVINGKPLHGLVHPEIGHMLVPEVEGITGVCPFHSHCVEGLASGSAIHKIWGKAAECLEDGHPAWAIEAKALGSMCHNLLMSFSAEKIILGGGVMNQSGLLEAVRESTEQSLNNYLPIPNRTSIADVICVPKLKHRSGLFGAYALTLSND